MVKTVAGLELKSSGSSSFSPLIMGIVNVTPDSFSDGGDFSDAERAIAHGKQLLNEGADILDIGGESTRPGADPVTVEEELARVLPVIEGLRGAAPISIDTRHSAVMQAAVEAGATIINDVSALTTDPDSVDVAARLGVPVMLMHMQGDPQTMQQRPSYDDVVAEVYAYLSERIDVCVASGIDRKQIIVDPGIGFGKTLDQNIALLRNLPRLQALGCPVLLGTSRKSTIEKIMGCPVPPKERLPGSLATLIPALATGVELVRVHDVAATKQFIAVARAIA